MKKEYFADVLGDISEDYIKEAMKPEKAKSRTWVKWAAIAACAAIVAVGGFAAWRQISAPSDIHAGVQIADSQTSETADSSGIPSITLNGTTYIVSSHAAVYDELPEGFELAGEASIGGDESYQYYVNLDVPEWVYVYQEVTTDGTLDSSGTLTDRAKHGAYVRYVDERLRGKALISFEGKFYISMWSAEYYGSSPDVTQEYYDEMKELYGVRIEGAVPEGFRLAGTAEFTGEDTVPTGELSSNTSPLAVYYNPANPSVIYAETYWYTATKEEKGETRHDGFNVYILYDCPFN
jgi:hypothetical protein